MDLSERVLKWCHDHHSQTLETIAKGLNKTPDKVDQALQKLRDQERLEFDDRGHWCYLHEEPAWVDAVLDAVHKGLEMWPFDFDHRCDWVEHRLLLAPACFDDEEGQGFSFFSLTLDHLLDLFDDEPSISLCNRHKEIDITGMIDGEEAWLTIQFKPFENSESVGKLLANGGAKLYAEEPI